MVCIMVLTYVFGGGMRSLSFANGLHASVLILLGGVILFLIVGKLGGADGGFGAGGPAASEPAGPRRQASTASANGIPDLHVRAACRWACFRIFSSIG